MRGIVYAHYALFRSILNYRQDFKYQNIVPYKS